MTLSAVDVQIKRTSSLMPFLYYFIFKLNFINFHEIVLPTLMVLVTIFHLFKYLTFTVSSRLSTRCYLHDLMNIHIKETMHFV